MQGVTILSLFDGKSGGQQAFERQGIPVDVYYASEIDPHAIAVTQYNYPNTIQLGSVTEISGLFLGHIDFVIGGSPCTSLSFAGKQHGLEGSSLEEYLSMKSAGEEFKGQSALFWEYVRVLKEVQLINPNVIFLLENVRMKPVWRDMISKELGVSPVEINSNLVSAQNRWRQYWTNLCSVKAPKDKGILLKDIVHEFTDNCAPSKGECDYMLRKSQNWAGNKCRFESYLQYKDNEKANAATQTFSKGVPYNCIFEELNEYVVPYDKTLRILEKEVERGKVGFFRKDSQANRVYYIHDKAITLTGESGGGAAKMGQYLFGCITPDRVNKNQNRQRFSDGLKFYTLTASEQSGVLVEGYIRKLTPIECERLQTVRDDYTKWGNYNGVVKEVSKTQRYKMLGNGWTIDAICHILSFYNSPH